MIRMADIVQLDLLKWKMIESSADWHEKELIMSERVSGQWTLRSECLERRNLDGLVGRRQKTIHRVRKNRLFCSDVNTLQWREQKCIPRPRNVLNNMLVVMDTIKNVLIYSPIVSFDQNNVKCENRRHPTCVHVCTLIQSWASKPPHYDMHLCYVASE